MLESFQWSQILCLPKHHSKKVVRLGLQWPSVASYLHLDLQTLLPRKIASQYRVATPGPTRAQALVKYVHALVKLLNGQA